MMFNSLEESVLIALQDLDENEIREKFFADNQSENAARVKLLEKIVEEAEIYEMQDALRRRDDAQEE